MPLSPPASSSVQHYIMPLHILCMHKMQCAFGNSVCVCVQCNVWLLMDLFIVILPEETSDSASRAFGYNFYHGMLVAHCIVCHGMHKLEFPILENIKAC